MSQSGTGITRTWYHFPNAFRLAMDSIRGHKLRSFLTLLGVIIGVASVVMVGAAIEGLGVYAEQSTAKAFGSESFLVAQIAATGRLSRRQYFDKIRHNKPIRRDEYRFLEAFNGSDVMYSPYRNHTSDVKRENLISEDATVIGVSADMADIRDIGVVEGRFFTAQEDRTRGFVAVIGETVKETLFPGVSPIGKIVRIEGVEFTVVGVQEKLGRLSAATRTIPCISRIPHLNACTDPGRASPYSRGRARATDCRSRRRSTRHGSPCATVSTTGRAKSIASIRSRRTPSGGSSTSC